jgi:ABC-type phosphate transport system substrate-binding protein
MHDEFLHRLRKKPRPEFAARLQARLWRPSMSPLRPAAPSRVRTLLTLLLIGGTAFAITAMVMRGLPVSLLGVYQDAAAWFRAERTRPPAARAIHEGLRHGLGWEASGPGFPHGDAGRSGPPHSAAPATGARAAATSPAASPGGSPSVVVGGSQIPQIRAVSSWAAQPYAAEMANRFNTPGEAPGVYVPPHIEVSLRDSHLWPGPMCSSAADAPDVGYAFEPAGTVSDRPCPPDASGHPSPVLAIPLGYEVLVLARSPLYGELDLTRRQIFLALAKWVPDPARPGTVHENASSTWRQVDPALGPEPIELMGPPLASPAGHSLIELLMEAGCNTYPWIAALESTDPARYARICRTVRTDGVYSAELSGLDASRLLAEPNAVGIIGSQWIFGFQGAREAPQLDGLLVSKLDGVEPTWRGIESGAYPGSRGLYLYVNRALGPYVELRLLRLPSGPFPDWALLGPSPQQGRADYDEVMRP